MGAKNDYVLDDLLGHARVCSNCFRMLKDETPVPERIKELAKRVQWADAVTPERVRYPTADSEAGPGESVSEWKKSTVCECGHFSQFAVTSRTAADPLDKRRAMDLAHHLDETLERLAGEHAERGELDMAARYTHDSDRLFDAVRQLKSTPRFQFMDDDVFRVAVRVATDAAGDNGQDGFRESAGDGG